MVGIEYVDCVGQEVGDLGRVKCHDARGMMITVPPTLHGLIEFFDTDEFSRSSTRFSYSSIVLVIEETNALAYADFLYDDSLHYYVTQSQDIGGL